MKAKKGLVLRDVCGEHIIVAEDKENIDLCDVISMNNTSAFLWNSVKDTDFDASTLAKRLVETYEVSEEEALKDASELLEQWQHIGIVE